jgi:hypothetical protein
MRKRVGGGGKGQRLGLGSELVDIVVSFSLGAKVLLCLQIRGQPAAFCPSLKTIKTKGKQK